MPFVRRTCSSLLLIILLSPSLTTGDRYKCSDDEESALRVQGTNESTAGRLEICHEHVWGVICANNWECSEARVACRQLGYQRSQRLIPSVLRRWKDAGNYTESAGPRVQWLDHVHCRGDELELRSCENSGYTLHHAAQRDCFARGEIVGVVCGVHFRPLHEGPCHQPTTAGYGTTEWRTGTTVTNKVFPSTTFPATTRVNTASASPSANTGLIVSSVLLAFCLLLLLVYSHRVRLERRALQANLFLLQKKMEQRGAKPSVTNLGLIAKDEATTHRTEQLYSTIGNVYASQPNETELDNPAIPHTIEQKDSASVTRTGAKRALQQPNKRRYDKPRGVPEKKNKTAPNASSPVFVECDLPSSKHENLPKSQSCDEPRHNEPRGHPNKLSHATKQKSSTASLAIETFWREVNIEAGDAEEHVLHDDLITPYTTMHSVNGQEQLAGYTSKIRSDNQEERHEYDVPEEYETALGFAAYLNRRPQVV